MFYVPRGLTKRFPYAFLISLTFPATDLECLIKNLIFNSLKFKQISFKQCPPLLAIPMIWNHLEYETCLRLVCACDLVSSLCCKVLIIVRGKMCHSINLKLLPGKTAFILCRFWTTSVNSCLIHLQKRDLDWFPHLRCMSLSVEETESEQNEIRSLQAQLESTNALVETLSKQLSDLREQVSHICFVLLPCITINPPISDTLY